jgi:hypothetical protein
MDAMKYLIAAFHVFQELPVIFPAFVGHNEMAEALHRKNAKVVSAGFARFDRNGRIRCYGTSVSLGLDSRGKRDEEVIESALKGEPTTCEAVP